MICQKCQKRPATTYLSETVNGHKKELYLCAECAAEHQSSFLDVGDFMQGFLGQTKRPPQQKSCPVCKMTERGYYKHGKLGCAACARTFEESTRSILQQVQGSCRHTGKVPAHGQELVRQQRELEQLEGKLRKAIAAEEYEEAARLRDQIRGLKGGEGACGTTK